MSGSTWNPEAYYSVDLNIPEYTGPSGDFGVPNQPTTTEGGGGNNLVSPEDIENLGANYQYGDLHYKPPVQVSKSDKQYASKTLAGLIESEYSDYLGRFKPFDQHLVNLIDNPDMLNKQLSRISANANSAQKSRMQSEAVRNSRFGIAPSALQQASQNRQSQLSAGLGIAQAKNNMRVATSDLQDSILTGSSGRSVLSDQLKNGG